MPTSPPLEQKPRLSVIDAFCNYGLIGGIAIGAVLGVCFAGPHFREWGLLESVLRIALWSGGLGALGWIAVGLAHGSAGGIGYTPYGAANDPVGGGGSGSGGCDAGGGGGGDCG